MLLRLRRASQIFFLALFLFLVLVTGALRLGSTRDLFLNIDPLIALSTALAAHSLPPQLLWALPVVVLTLVLGRFFCGWVCPMGTLHHALGWLWKPKRAQDRIGKNRSRPSQKTKYFILLAMLGMAAAGSAQAGLLDPLASLWRALSLSIIPAASNTAFGLYQGERHFHWSTLIAVVFFGALALNALFPRFYCRVLCPLGALLGLLSKLSLFRISRKAELCKDCNLCGSHCQGAAEPQGKTRTAECMLCMNCVASCPRQGMGYGFLPPPEVATTDIDLGRRRWLTAAFAGVAAVPLLRASDGVRPRPHPKRIRPPGALEEEALLARCAKCGACMKVCPNGGLQPALHEAGLEGLWTPILIPRIGPCEQSCTACGRVCPTGAIARLTTLEKVGSPPDLEPVRIGSAAVDKGRCLPWANDTPCIVCQEVCPTSPKAIYFKTESVVARDGREVALQRPYVSLELCTGCGTCEARCPIFDRAGIRVSSVGESRSGKNQAILSRGKL
jgi:polyferredoxin